MGSWRRVSVAIGGSIWVVDSKVMTPLYEKHSRVTGTDCWSVARRHYPTAASRRAERSGLEEIKVLVINGSTSCIQQQTG